MEQQRRRRDYFHYIMGSITLAAIIGFGSWAFNKFQYFCETFPVILHKLEDIKNMENKVNEIDKKAGENNVMLQDLKKTQSLIKDRQAKVIQTLHDLMKMHKIPDRLPYDNYYRERTKEAPFEFKAELGKVND